MKVLLVNGSPHEKGCTYTALTEVAGVLEKEGIAAEFFWSGLSVPIRGCTGCRACRSGSGFCVYKDDPVNALIEAAKGADGFVFGSPVHYSGPSGDIVSLLDRAFYAGSAAFMHKPGACVVSCRRGGNTATFDQLNKYLMISQMPVASSQYWNMVHGNTPEEVKQDLEGMQTMRTLGRNLAWLMKCIEAGKAAGIELSAPEQRVQTNFVR